MVSKLDAKKIFTRLTYTSHFFGESNADVRSVCDR